MPLKSALALIKYLQKRTNFDKVRSLATVPVQSTEPEPYLPNVDPRDNVPLDRKVNCL